MHYFSDTFGSVEVTEDYNEVKATEMTREGMQNIKCLYIANKNVRIVLL